MSYNLILINITMKTYQIRKIYQSLRKGQSIDLKPFSQHLSSKQRLHSLKKVPLLTNNSSTLLFSLANLNLNKFTLFLFLMIVQLSISISSPFFANYLISNHLNDPNSHLFMLILIFTLYKLAKIIVSIVCDFCYQSLGYEYFARLYWELLAKYQAMSGKMLNMIEYDCNILSNFPFASLTAFFDSVEIIVILGLFTYYLSSLPSFSIFAVIIVLYLCSQGLVSFLTFRFTKKYLKEKDKRLNFNIINDISTEMKDIRAQQLSYNRQFLYCKILSKFVTIVYPILINIYVFVIADRTKINEIEYILLILINLIRNPISQLLFTLNLLVEISYSSQRIVSFAKGAQKGTNEDTLSLTVQALQGEKIVEKKKNFPLQDGRQLNQQKGLIKMNGIKQYCMNKQNINLIYWILLVISILLLVSIRCYNYYITKHIIANKYSTLDFIGLGFQLIIPLLLYFLLIVISQKIACTLFSKLKADKFNCQFLNRISGDITAIDRSITINFNQTISSFAFIISSYLYSILSLNNLYLQLSVAAFLSLCMLAAYKANRFIMLSRREVARQECLLKAKIIKNLMRKKHIQTSKPMKRAWRNIFQCKEMGLFIQNFFMIILNAIILIFTLVLISLCKELDIDPINKSILLIACLNIDFDIMNTFISAVRLEICMVSFERVVNALDNDSV